VVQLSEVVRNAASQAPDRLHLGRLPQLPPYVLARAITCSAAQRCDSDQPPPMGRIKTGMDFADGVLLLAS